MTDPSAPEWERAKPLEAYPTIRSRRLSELSIPWTRAAGQRAARVAVSSPEPQPRSTTSSGSRSLIRAVSSKNALLRSSEYRAYWWVRGGERKTEGG